MQRVSASLLTALIAVSFNEPMLLTWGLVASGPADGSPGGRLDAARYRGECHPDSLFRFPHAAEWQAVGRTGALNNLARQDPTDADSIERLL